MADVRSQMLDIRCQISYVKFQMSNDRCNTSFIICHMMDVTTATDVNDVTTAKTVKYVTTVYCLFVASSILLCSLK